MLLGAAATVLAGTTLVRVERLRRTAGAHAHDLERTATVGEGPGAPVRLLVLGDSAARGYGLADAASAFPQQLARGVARATGRRVAVSSLATDGHRTADVLAEQVPLVRGADVVVLSVGVNDAIRRTPLDDLAAGTDELLATARATTDGVVAFVPCPDLGGAPGFGWPLAGVVGWSCRRVARVQQRVARDHDVVVLPLPRPDATMFGTDGFHPGAAGHAAMAREVVHGLLARVDQALARAATPTD